jgi:hypothetical protein
MESGQDHIQVDSNGKRIIIKGKSYYLLDLIYDMVTNHKGLLSFDSHLYNFLNILNFAKSLISNYTILKKLNENSPSSTTLKQEEETDKNLKCNLENTSKPSRNNDLMTTPVVARQKQRRINSSSSHTSMQKGSGHYTTCFRSKWLKF